MQVFENSPIFLHTRKRSFIIIKMSRLLAFCLSFAAFSNALASEIDIDGEEASLHDLLIGTDNLEDGGLVNNEENSRWALEHLLIDDFAASYTLRHQLRSIEEQYFSPAEAPYIRELRRSYAVGLMLPQADHAVAQVKGIEFDIPLADHPLVDTYVDYFTRRGRWFFERWLGRSARYIPIMQPILESYGLPRDLVYLAMIESGFSAKAYSSAAAVGFWQFIRSTGTMYGLRNDFWVDDRRDFILATHSAARYLKDLYREFDDWHLAWAAYNAGSGKVNRAIAKVGRRDFWALINDRKALAKETKHYVPKIIAAAIVAKDIARFGLALDNTLSVLEYDELDVEGAVDLRLLARDLDVDMELMRDLNPVYLHDITPPGRKAKIRVPKGQATAALAWLEKHPADQRMNYAYHIVKKGDTLSQIARRFGTTVDVIRQFNRQQNFRFLRVGQSIIIPQVKSPRVPSQNKAKPVVVSMQSLNGRSAANQKHIVTSGETLWSIAQRYGVSVDNLKNWNRRTQNAIGVGDVLYILADRR